MWVSLISSVKVNTIEKKSSDGKIIWNLVQKADIWRNIKANPVLISTSPKELLRSVSSSHLYCKIYILCCCPLCPPRLSDYMFK